MLQAASPHARRAAVQAAAAPPEPNLRAALARVMALMAIPGRSGQEAKVIEFITRELRQAGVPPSALKHDRSHLKSPLKGEIGGLVCQFPGTMKGPRRLLMAHVDTVPLCVGSKPVRRGDHVASGNKATGLGADDRAGATVVLTAALEIVRRRLPHPPLTFFWPVQEEVGLHGAQFVELPLLGKPTLAFNWDGGDSDKLTIGATGAYRLQIEITGLASHAGGAPEKGVSAIAIASLAIARLQEEGWHGDVKKGEKHGTSNVGVIQGGEATNVVTDRVFLRAEARSHDREFRRELVRQITEAFEDAARQVKNHEGVCGKVSIASRLDYESFVLPQDDPSVAAAEGAIRSIGREPFRAISNGGLDANWLTARGLPTVTLGCGQENPHTLGERLDIAAFERACRIALRLATAS